MLIFEILAWASPVFIILFLVIIPFLVNLELILRFCFFKYKELSIKDLNMDYLIYSFFKFIFWIIISFIPFLNVKMIFIHIKRIYEQTDLDCETFIYNILIKNK